MFDHLVLFAIRWDGQGAYDRSRGNRRNWILVWEDGFCNFAASTGEVSSGECSGSGSTAYGHSDYQQYQGLQPELFFKMSHEIYNYGEGYTIALISVREGVVQLGAVHKVIEDLSYVVMLRKKLSYIESIPGVLLPHPSSSGYPFINASPSDTWHFPGVAPPPPSQPEYHQQRIYHSDHHHHFLMGHHQQPMKITPSMSSLEALLSKLPSVVPSVTQA
ncbi:hypothetical protein DY000_02012900, partial [Brassica cretica]